MGKTIFFWVLAFVITIITAVYQRVTGPTYPVSDSVELNGETINFKLYRSHGGHGDHLVTLETDNPRISGYLNFKRYKTNDNWSRINMDYIDGKLTAKLPHQPPAGKLEYYIEIIDGLSHKIIPEYNSVVIRFKGDVPLFVLIPHIIAMFLSMLLSTRTGLEFFNNGNNLKKLTYWTIGLLFIGGFILGPLTQKYAFGEYWTGIPFGYDLTDNKTLFAMIGWVGAYFLYSKSKAPKKWALFASLLLIVVYLIPHSMMGSEIDYNKLDKEKQNIEKLKE